MDNSQNMSLELQRRLQFLVRHRPEWWLYSIFWQAVNDSNGNPFFKWRDGHFLETNKSNNMSDYEWFYNSSATRSFGVEDRLVGSTFLSGGHVWLAGQKELQVYGCERVKEAWFYEIRTIVCVATCFGVVELASSDLVEEDRGLVRIIKSLFAFDNPGRPFSVDINIDVSRERHVARGGGGTKHLCSSSTSSGKDEEYEVSEYQILCNSNDDHYFTKKKVAASVMNRTVRTMNTDSDNMFASNSMCRFKRKKFSNNKMCGTKKNQSRTEAERRRRERLNHLIQALRSAVPNVAKLDKASLLDVAVSYIKQLRSKIDDLEAKKSNNKNIANNTCIKLLEHEPKWFEKVEVRIVGSNAVISVESEDLNSPAARLMGALQKSRLRIHRASGSTVNGMFFQNVVVSVPDVFCCRGEALRSAIFRRLKNLSDSQVFNYIF